MEDRDVTVRFEPDGRKVKVATGTVLSEAALLAGIPLEGPCGGQGTCGKCLVMVTGGEVPGPGDEELRALTMVYAPEGMRLACRLAAVCDMVVDVTGPTRRYRQSVLIDGWGRVAAPLLEPRVGRELLGIDGPLLGVAVDLGTTTVASELVDLETGRVLARFADMNPQIPMGEDVVTRVSCAINRDRGDALTAMLRDVVNRSIEGLSAEAGVQTSDVHDVMLVGNTCMHHMFFGLDLSGLARHPYDPADKGAVDAAGTDLGLLTSERARVASLPVVAGYLGADAVAAALASGLDNTPEGGLRMVVDIGTNGEVLLASGGKLFGSSSPAGPAFEGAQISCGMRASDGAIVRAEVSEDGTDIEIRTIGDAPPRGIAGSGLLDLVAGLVVAGVIDPTGKLVKDHPRVTKEGGGSEYLVHEGAPRIVLTQKDVRQVQLAKAAIISGIRIVLKEAGASSQSIEELVLAGAFGTFIEKANAIRIGMLPDLPLDRMTVAGNAALVGARMALLSMTQRARAKALAEGMTHVQLAGREDFQQEFMKGLRF